MLVTSIFSFPAMFSTVWKTNLIVQITFNLSFVNAFSLDKANILSSVQPFQNKPFENSVGKGEIARNEQFLFSHSGFYLFEQLSAIFIKFKIVVCKLFQFG